MLEGQYGMPYQGSKGQVIDSIALIFPPADHFYDLFGGGGSVIHYMSDQKRHKFKHFHYNEINAVVADIFQRALTGEFNEKIFKPKWISKEEFDRLRNMDGYIRCCWSFGNNGRNYLYGKKIETYKKSMHKAVVFGEFDELAREVLRKDRWPLSINTIELRRLYLRHIIEHHRKTKIPKGLHKFLSEKQLKELPQLKQLQHLQHLERLKQLQRLEKVEALADIKVTNKSYDEVEIYPNSIVYCDIPYEETGGYGVHFDRRKFLDWAANASFPVYISEYEIQDPRFQCVYEIKKAKIFKNVSSSKSFASEKLYWNGVKLSGC